MLFCKFIKSMLSNKEKLFTWTEAKQDLIPNKEGQYIVRTVTKHGRINFLLTTLHIDDHRKKHFDVHNQIVTHFTNVPKL